ncbi:MAG: TonB-dependent receptor [Halieaceae bacterium]
MTRCLKQAWLTLQAGGNAALLLFLLTPSLLSAADAEISSIYGVGEYRLDATSGWNQARVEQELFGGNFVRTGAYSRLGLLFSDRTQLRINEKTVLHIRELSDPTSNTGQTRLRLERGRVWTRTNLVPRGLEMETPAATAAIRGTDWDMQVASDGSATVTVLNGSVNFFNAHGQVLVAAGEQARAVPGSAPVKIVLVRPADRVQWVTAYAIEPLRHIDLAGVSVNPELTAAFAALAKSQTAAAARQFDLTRTGGDPALDELLALGRASVDIQREQLGPALDRLARLTSDPSIQVAARLIASDIYIFTGDLAAAGHELDSALRDFPDNAQVLSQQARLALVSGDTSQSAELAQQALQLDDNSLPAWLVTGAVARIQGNAARARQAYNKAIHLQPQDDRGWFGLGQVNSEREEVRWGRKNLAQALSLNPQGPGYRGALATLDAFAWLLDEAEAEFRTALDDTPDDYVALTGQAVTQLKRGEPDEALDSLLRAQIMEPRYARAHIYAAVAHYQSGRRSQALAELAQAKQVDPLDPAPWLMDSIVFTDLLQPDKAVAASRQALQRMPYLKSLNQIANDRKGSANLGRAFAFWGLEEWAQSYAQESYYPFWGGSHLFLADRYNGRFNKNSELFQGFLSDPLAIGASNRFNSLMKRPGNYLSGSLRYSESDDVDGTTPFLQASGMNYAVVPTAYFLGYSRFNLDFDTGPRDSEHYTLGFGVQARHDISLFLFLDSNKLDDEVDVESQGLALDTDQDLSTDRIDLGSHIRFTPRAQLWLKAGYFDSNDNINGALALTGEPSQRIDIQESIEQPDFSTRFTFELGTGHDISLGAEYVDRDTKSLGSLGIPELSLIGGSAQFDERFDEKSLELYVADRLQLGEQLLLQAELSYQDQDRDNTQKDSIVFPFFDDVTFSPESADRSRSGGYFRLGAVYRFAPERLLRVAYQDWLRPLSFSTLGDVATAGIPVDDRLVAPGGELQRIRAQLEWAYSGRTFSTAFFDYKEIDSNRFDFRPLDFVSKREVESLQNLQQRDRGSLARDDMLEFASVPEFDQGEVTEAGFSINHILSRDWSAYARYIYRDSENTGTEFDNNELPLLPDDTVALGATWIRQDGWYLTGRMVHRSHRYLDAANQRSLESGWSGAFDLYWESASKQWLLRFSVDDAFDDNLETLYTGELNLRL